MTRLAVIGAGSWGTALSIALGPRFDEVRLWVHEPDLARRIETARENAAFLPGLPLPPNVAATDDISLAVSGAEVALGVMPSRFARAVWTSAAPHLTPSAFAVSATKGLEAGSLLRISEVIGQSAGAGRRIAVLSGPTFAREVARGDPAAMVIASRDADMAAAIQRQFSGPLLRLYTSADPVGVEIGAALKNVVAIAAGVCVGLGLGGNALAALITRGLAEIGRLAIAMGGRAQTLAGLAGLGDLVLTCTGELSRNRAVGLELAKGRGIAEIVESTVMVAEGVDTTAAAVELARRHGVAMPIAFQMDRVLRGQCPPAVALRELMERSLKEE